MSDSTIRLAGREDIEVVVDLNQGLFREDSGSRDSATNPDWPRQEGAAYFSAFIDNRQTLLLVAGPPDAVTGYLAGRLHAASTLRPVVSASLESIFVEPASRGTGIGTALSRIFFAWANDHGANVAQVTAHARNESAIRLYERLGFEPLHLTLERTLPGIAT